MATVAQKAYHCTYMGLSGILTKPAGTCLFLEHESSAVISLSDVEVHREVVVQGAVSEAMAQYLADMAAGGAAAVACSRQMEVA